MHTNTIPDPAAHPVRRYFDLGVPITLNTDSRLMDGTTLADEYWLAHEKLGFTRAELDRVILNACEYAFLPEAEKRDLVSRMTSELEEIA
jgi:adenosine deaminase